MCSLKTDVLILLTHTEKLDLSVDNGLIALVLCSFSFCEIVL